MQDITVLPQLVHDILQRASSYDRCFTAYTTDGNFVDIASLQHMDVNAMSYLFQVEIKQKPTSTRADGHVTISIQRRQQFTDIKQRALKYAWLKTHSLWVTETDTS